MFIKRFIYCISSLSIISFLYNCNATKKQEYRYFMFASNEDTTYMRLQIFPEIFYGDLIEKNGVDILKQGDFKGEVKNDTLLGSLYYTPKGHRNAKKKAFAILVKENEIFLGYGKSYNYMGTPFFWKPSLKFDTARKFKEVGVIKDFIK